MKILVKLLVILALGACNKVTKPDRMDISANQAEIYRSTKDSFQQDFYLKIEKEKATIYGWEIVIKQNLSLLLRCLSLR